MSDRPAAVIALRNAPADHRTDDETPDDKLTRFRRRGDQLAADYVTLLVTAGLTPAYPQTVLSRYVEWRKYIADHMKTARRAPPVSRTAVERGGGRR